EAITVSALADSDGAAGGLGAALSLTFADGLTCVYPDDSFARVLDNSGQRWRYTNYGAGVDIAAPGTRIYSTCLGQGYATLTGTSMAAPHVAGAAALVLARWPAFSPAQVAAALTDPLNATLDYTYKAAGDDPDGLQEPLLNVRNF
ncbi:MAG TPA: S8 family serine peptidase, partial [Candidatus Nitrosotenuis sp.]|nr:S8 family serine peptidase [Candidatus Nitrosotenuis sp.]